MPRAAAVNARGEIYVCEYTLSERVQHFTAHGEKCLGAFGRPGNGPGEFSRAEGLGIDAPGPDLCGRFLQSSHSDFFRRTAIFCALTGRPARDAGELSYPYDMQVDPSGLQFVCEFGNSRIQIFDANDQPLEILGGPAAAPGQFSNPWGLALDSKGNLYVADAMNNRVQKFVRKNTAPAGAAPDDLPIHQPNLVVRPGGGRGVGRLAVVEIRRPNPARGGAGRPWSCACWSCWPWVWPWPGCNGKNPSKA